MHRKIIGICYIYRCRLEAAAFRCGMGKKVFEISPYLGGSPSSILRDLDFAMAELVPVQFSSNVWNYGAQCCCGTVLRTESMLMIKKWIAFSNHWEDSRLKRLCYKRQNKIGMNDLSSGATIF